MRAVDNWIMFAAQSKANVGKDVCLHFANIFNVVTSIRFATKSKP